MAGRVWNKYSDQYAVLMQGDDYIAEWKMLNSAAEDYLFLRTGMSETAGQFRGRSLEPEFEMKKMASLAADLDGPVTEVDAGVDKAQW